MRYYVQRSTDGQVIYIRKEPNVRWEAKIDAVSGAHYVFEDLRPGEGRYYEFSRYMKGLRKEIGMRSRRGYTLFELVIGIGIALIALVVLAPLVAVCLPTGCDPNYSDGDRVGTVMKISQKGIFYKSWEGELFMPGFTVGENGAPAPNIWRFSLRDELAARSLMALGIGRPVRLHYRQYLIKPWRFETEYVVDGFAPEEPRSPK